MVHQDPARQKSFRVNVSLAPVATSIMKMSQQTLTGKCFITFQTAQKTNLQILIVFRVTRV